MNEPLPVLPSSPSEVGRFLLFPFRLFGWWAQGQERGKVERAGKLGPRPLSSAIQPEPSGWRTNGFLMALSCLLILAAVPVGAAPAPPDWILVDASDQPGFWVVTWPSVADADGYQIYLQIGAANVAEDETPEPVLARWGYVEQQDGVIRVIIAALSQETFSFGVATVKDGVESEITWPAQPSQPTSALAPPESVWIEEYGDGVVTLAWTAVPEADGYRIYGEVLVTVALNADGDIVPLETPEVVWVSLGYVEQQDAEIIRATVPILEEGPPALAVAAEKDGVNSEIAWPPPHPDFNRDGQVNLEDFFLLADAYGTTLRGFDLDRDGRVDLDDYFLFANAFQTDQWQPEN